MKQDKPLFDMGSATAEIFRGHSESRAIKEVYGMSAAQFADIIMRRLPISEKEYTLLDVGSSKGELLSETLKLLPEYHFRITVIDTNPDALAHNDITGAHVVADAENLPLEDKSIDVAIMRYVLQFNSMESQAKIISELSRVVKEIAIVQHAGADTDNVDIWREKVGKIFVNDNLPQLKRNGMYWSSVDEIEGFMSRSGIKFERVQSKKIDDLSEVYVERYSLSDVQAKELRAILAGSDYIMQTTWMIYPKGVADNN